VADRTLELAADIVSAFVSNNSVPQADLPNIVAAVHAVLNQLSTGSAPIPVEAPKEPATSIKKSVTPDYVMCLECGKKFKSMKRHIRNEHALTPERYREKWKLSADYPMVAPNYAKARSALAKSAGLGQKKRPD
jgi:predicted transcriptional regulator